MSDIEDYVVVEIPKEESILKEEIQKKKRKHLEISQKSGNIGLETSCRRSFGFMKYFASGMEEQVLRINSCPYIRQIVRLRRSS